MPRSNSTPSIVPNVDDQTVYLVLDNFGDLGRAYCETDVERADLETVISVCLMDSIKTRYGWSGQHRGRLVTRRVRPMLPASCAGAATSRCAMCRSFFRTSWTGTKAGTVTS